MQREAGGQSGTGQQHLAGPVDRRCINKPTVAAPARRCSPPGGNTRGHGGGTPPPDPYMYKFGPALTSLMSLAEKGIPRLTPDKTEERSFDPRSSRPRGRKGRRSCLCPAAHSRYGARLRAPIAPKQRSSDRKDTQARERTSFASSSSARSARGHRFGSINFVKMEDVSTEALARSAFVT